MGFGLDDIEKLDQEKFNDYMEIYRKIRRLESEIDELEEAVNERENYLNTLNGHIKSICPHSKIKSYKYSNKNPDNKFCYYCDTELQMVEQLELDL